MPDWTSESLQATFLEKLDKRYKEMFGRSAPEGKAKDRYNEVHPAGPPPAGWSWPSLEERAGNMELSCAPWYENGPVQLVYVGRVIKRLQATGHYELIDWPKSYGGTHFGFHVDEIGWDIPVQFAAILLEYCATGTVWQPPQPPQVPASVAAAMDRERRRRALFANPALRRRRLNFS